MFNFAIFCYSWFRSWVVLYVYILDLLIVLNKKLLADIMNQSKLLNMMLSANISNCFNRVIYPITGMAYEYFELLLDFIILFFIIIQEMEIYLLTLCGISTSSYTRESLAFSRINIR